MSRVAVLGATGFVGSAVADALRARGAEVTAVRAPRLTSASRTPDDLVEDLRSASAVAAMSSLREALRGCDAVVNAAGVSRAVGPRDQSMVGANALLPVVVAEARPAGARLVHVSSVAVQGGARVLDESRRHAPFSPYSATKSLGEQALEGYADVVVFRPTSVHGRDRAVTRTLVRVMSSPAASVAGRGDGPTPQVLVANVGDAIAFVALSPQSPPPVVLQPSEHLTVRELVQLLGDREPRHVPTSLARLVVRATTALGRWYGPAAGASRRVEMMWFGQAQGRSWLDGRWTAPVGREGWKELAR